MNALPLILQLLDLGSFFSIRQGDIRFNESRLFAYITTQHNIRATTGHIGCNRDHFWTSRLRNDLCLATFLQNREVDDGGAPVRHWVSRVVYAFASSLFNLHGHVSQGAAHCALTPTVMRRLGNRDPQEMCAIARALGVWKEGDPAADAPFRAADQLEKVFASIGMPINLAPLDVPQSSIDAILEPSLTNFNADPKQEFVKERDLLREVLKSAW